MTSITIRTPQRKKRRIDYGMVVSALVIAIFVLAAIFAPLVAPYDPLAQDLRNIMLPPFVSLEHPLGTDFLGRDLLSRTIFGAIPPLVVGFAAVLIAMVIGVSLGLVSGRRDGFLDTLIGRIADIQMSIPGLVLALLVLAMLGKNLAVVMLVIALESWPVHYRVVRAYVQTVRNNGYIEAARLANVSSGGIIVRHLLPGVAPLLAVTATANFAMAVLAEAALSFLGMGVTPPTADWGVMVAEGQAQLGAAWWISLVPGAALVAVLLSVQILGNSLSSWRSLREGDH